MAHAVTHFPKDKLKGATIRLEADRKTLMEIVKIAEGLKDKPITVEHKSVEDARKFAKSDHPASFGGFLKVLGAEGNATVGSPVDNSWPEWNPDKVNCLGIAGNLFSTPVSRKIEDVIARFLKGLNCRMTKSFRVQCVGCSVGVINDGNICVMKQENFELVTMVVRMTMRTRLRGMRMSIVFVRVVMVMIFTANDVVVNSHIVRQRR